jgi:HEAT repeat protein
VPRLLELLGSDDELVRDGAIGALVALRDQRAIKPLTELASFSDVDMMRRVIDAVGAIGGEDARSYLELVAAGHEVPAVRELAEGALARLARRAGDGGT